VILSDKTAPAVLLIERPKRQSDPWSGQIAFPGGKFQEGDVSLKATAIRETLEEVGIDLERSSDFLGFLGTFRTHTANIEVVPAVFLLRGKVRLRTNKEVASHMWADLSQMLSGQAKFSHRVLLGGELREVPAFKVGDYVVWGLTHRIISALVDSGSA